MSNTIRKSGLYPAFPVVDNICFCEQPGEDMSKKLFTSQNGVFSRRVSFRDRRRVFPYQIQYRQRSRYANYYKRSTGASWTNWTDWLNAIAMQGIPLNATQTDYPVDTWLKANKGVNKNGSYVTITVYNNVQLPTMFDARQIQFRVRTFDQAMCKHGYFKNQVLTIYRGAELLDLTAITAPDGGVKFKYNFTNEQSAGLVVTTLTDSSGRQLLESQYMPSVTKAYLTSQTVPAIRQNCFDGMFTIPIEKLKRKLDVNEQIKITFRVYTSDGTVDNTHSLVITQLHRNIDVSMSYQWNQDTAMLRVAAANNEQNALYDIGCNVSYTYNDKVYSIAPFYKEIDLEGTSTFYFYPPIGIQLTANLKAEDTNDFKGSSSIDSIMIQSAGYRLNKMSEKVVCAIAWGKPSYTISSSPKYETSLPYGRSSNIIFYGEGATTTITFTAKIVDKDYCYGGEYARKLAWENVINNQGVYVFRSNKGDLYKVGITGINIKHEVKDIYDLQVNMVRVE